MKFVTYTAPATISKIITMADRCLRLQVDCQEMPPEHEALMFQLRGRLGSFAFKEGKIENEEITAMPETSPGSTKSSCQRLRNVLYILWEQTGKIIEFETYYRINMEKFIESIKEQLN